MTTIAQAAASWAYGADAQRRYDSLVAAIEADTWGEHDMCSLVACRAPLHPGPCKGWKHTLHLVSPGAFHALERHRVDRLNARRLAQVAKLKSEGKPVPPALLKTIMPKTQPGKPPANWNPGEIAPGQPAHLAKKNVDAVADKVGQKAKAAAGAAHTEGEKIAQHAAAKAIPPKPEKPKAPPAPAPGDRVKIVMKSWNAKAWGTSTGTVVQGSQPNKVYVALDAHPAWVTPNLLHDGKYVTTFQKGSLEKIEPSAPRAPEPAKAPTPAQKAAAEYIPPHVKDVKAALAGGKLKSVGTYTYGGLNVANVQHLTPEERTKLSEEVARISSMPKLTPNETAMLAETRASLDELGVPAPKAPEPAKSPDAPGKVSHGTAAKPATPMAPSAPKAAAPEPDHGALAGQANTAAWSKHWMAKRAAYAKLTPEAWAKLTPKTQKRIREDVAETGKPGSAESWQEVRERIDSFTDAKPAAPLKVVSHASAATAASKGGTLTAKLSAYDALTKESWGELTPAVQQKIKQDLILMPGKFKNTTANVKVLAVADRIKGFEGEPVPAKVHAPSPAPQVKTLTPGEQSIAQHAEAAKAAKQAGIAEAVAKADAINAAPPAAGWPATGVNKVVGLLATPAAKVTAQDLLAALPSKAIFDKGTPEQRDALLAKLKEIEDRAASDEVGAWGRVAHDILADVGDPGTRNVTRRVLASVGSDKYKIAAIDGLSADQIADAPNTYQAVWGNFVTKTSPDTPGYASARAKLEAVGILTAKTPAAPAAPPVDGKLSKKDVLDTIAGTSPEDWEKSGPAGQKAILDYLGKVAEDAGATAEEKQQAKAIAEKLAKAAEPPVTAKVPKQSTAAAAAAAVAKSGTAKAKLTAYLGLDEAGWHTLDEATQTKIKQDLILMEGKFADPAKVKDTRAIAAKINEWAPETSGPGYALKLAALHANGDPIPGGDRHAIETYVALPPAQWAGLGFDGRAQIHKHLYAIATKKNQPEDVALDALDVQGHLLSQTPGFNQQDSITKVLSLDPPPGTPLDTVNMIANAMLNSGNLPEATPEQKALIAAKLIALKQQYPGLATSMAWIEKHAEGDDLAELSAPAHLVDLSSYALHAANLASKFKGHANGTDAKLAAAQNAVSATSVLSQAEWDALTPQQRGDIWEAAQYSSVHSMLPQQAINVLEDIEKLQAKSPTKAAKPEVVAAAADAATITEKGGGSLLVMQALTDHLDKLSFDALTPAQQGAVKGLVSDQATHGLGMTKVLAKTLDAKIHSWSPGAILQANPEKAAPVQGPADYMSGLINLAHANALDGVATAATKKAILAQLEQAKAIATPHQVGELEQAHAALSKAKTLTPAQAKAKAAELANHGTDKPLSQKANEIVQKVLYPGGYHGPKQSAIAALSKQEFDQLPLSQRAAIGWYVREGVEASAGIAGASSTTNAEKLFGSIHVPQDLVNYQLLTNALFPGGESSLAPRDKATPGNLGNIEHMLTRETFQAADPGMRDAVRDILKSATADPALDGQARKIADKLGITLDAGSVPTSKNYGLHILNKPLGVGAVLQTFSPDLPNPSPGGHPGAHYVAGASASTAYRHGADVGTLQYPGEEVDPMALLKGAYVTSPADLLRLRRTIAGAAAGNPVHDTTGGISDLDGVYRTAAAAYTTSDYVDMNDVMRKFAATGKWPEGSGAVLARNLREAYRQEKVGRLARDTTLFRGFTNGETVLGKAWGPNLAGVEFTNDAFTSTSTKHGVAYQFGGGGSGQNGVVMRISAPAGTQAFSGYKGGGLLAEREIVLGPGTHYRVVADHGWHNGVRYIDVEVTNGGPGSIAASAAKYRSSGGLVVAF